MEDSFFLLDIGTSFLKGLFFSVDGNQTIVNDFLKIPYNRESKNDFKVKLKEFASFLKKNKDLKVKKAMITAGEGVGIGKLREVNFFRKNESKKILDNEFKKILKEIQRESFFEAKKEFKGGRIKIVNSRVQKISVDGMSVEDLSKTRGRDVFFKMINFYLPLDIHDAIKKVFSSFKIEPFFFYSPSIIPSALSCFKGGSEVFIDVGGKNTQILFSRKKEIENIKIFNIGGENFLSRISDFLKIKKEDIILGDSEEEINIRVKKNILSQNNQSRIEDCLKLEYEKWEEKIFFSLREVRDWKIPKHIYVFGGGSKFLFFERFKEKFAKPPFCFIIKRINIFDFKNTQFHFNDIQAISPLIICEAIAKGKIKAFRSRISAAKIKI